MRVIAGPTGAPDLVLINGVIPNEREWEEIREKNLTVNVLELPDASSNLKPLLPWADFIRDLSINSYTCSDLRDLVSFPSLEALSIGGRITRPPIDFAPQTLRDFAGPYKGFELILAQSPLTRAKIALNASSLGEITTTIETLTLTSARRLEMIASLGSLQSLRRLAIHGAKQLDLKGLHLLSALEEVRFESCASVTSAHELRQAPKLVSVVFENVARLMEESDLYALESQVRVIARNPFDAEFRKRVGNNWIFPPGRGVL